MLFYKDVKLPLSNEFHCFLVENISFLECQQSNGEKKIIIIKKKNKNCTKYDTHNEMIGEIAMLHL